MPGPGLIIETDIGDDPDDYMMLLHLLMQGVRIDALLLSPGHPSQVALCRFVFAQLGITAPPIGVADRPHWRNQPINRMHAGFMAQPAGSREFWVDGPGHEVAREVLKNIPTPKCSSVSTVEHRSVVQPIPGSRGHSDDDPRWLHRASRARHFVHPFGRDGRGDDTAVL